MLTRGHAAARTMAAPAPTQRSRPSRLRVALWASVASTLATAVGVAVLLEETDADAAALAALRSSAAPAVDVADQDAAATAHMARVGREIHDGDGDYGAHVDIALRLPGRLPPLPETLEARQRRLAAAAAAADLDAARKESVQIADHMARDLEDFIAGLRTLPRGEQRKHARAVEHHFDWHQADRLAVLRQRLPLDERYRLQEVVFQRIRPMIAQLDALAAED